MHDKIKKKYCSEIKYFIDHFFIGDKFDAEGYYRKAEKTMIDWIDKYYKSNFFKNKDGEKDFLKKFLLWWVFEESDVEKYQIRNIDLRYWDLLEPYFLAHCMLAESIKDFLADTYGILLDYYIDEDKMYDYSYELSPEFIKNAEEKTGYNYFLTILYIKNNLRKDGYDYFLKMPFETLKDKGIVKHFSHKS